MNHDQQTKEAKKVLPAKQEPISIHSEDYTSHHSDGECHELPEAKLTFPILGSEKQFQKNVAIPDDIIHVRPRVVDGSTCTTVAETIQRDNSSNHSLFRSGPSKHVGETVSQSTAAVLSDNFIHEHTTVGLNLETQFF